VETLEERITSVEAIAVLGRPRASRYEQFKASGNSMYYGSQVSVFTVDDPHSSTYSSSLSTSKPISLSGASQSVTPPSRLLDGDFGGGHIAI